MKLVGKSICLRVADQQDVEVIFGWENDPANWLVSETLAPYSREQIEAFIEENNDLYQDGQMRLMIRRLPDDRAVGCIDLFGFDPKNKRVGVGILIDGEFRGMGYGHEALELLVRYAFRDLEVHSIYAEVLADNLSSIHLFESAQFQLCGTKKDWLWDGQHFIDQHIFQIVAP